MAVSVPLAVVCAKHARTPHTSRSSSWCWQVHGMWRIWLKAFCALKEPAARPAWAVVGKRKKSGRSERTHLPACVHRIFHVRFSTSLHIPLIGLLHHSASRHWVALQRSSSGLLPNWHGYKAVRLGPIYPTRTRSTTRLASLVSRTVTDLLIRPLRASPSQSDRLSAVSKERAVYIVFFDCKKEKTKGDQEPGRKINGGDTWVFRIGPKYARSPSRPLQRAAPAALLRRVQE